MDFECEDSLQNAMTKVLGEKLSLGSQAIPALLNPQGASISLLASIPAPQIGSAWRPVPTGRVEVVIPAVFAIRLLRGIWPMESCNKSGPGRPRDSGQLCDLYV
jgi:hypothetical protein